MVNSPESKRNMGKKQANKPKYSNWEKKNMFVISLDQDSSEDHPYLMSEISSETKAKLSNNAFMPQIKS
jgi:hypothetical protein